jgi:hypothetical protein
MAGAEALEEAVFCVPAWNARSVVQTGVSAQTSEEMALLAMGGVSSFARCKGGSFHV